MTPYGATIKTSSTFRILRTVFLRPKIDQRRKIVDHPPSTQEQSLENTTEKAGASWCSPFVE
jgi:hypothetical protein